MLLIGMGIAISSEAIGQVEPPELKCISGDSLVWEVPEVSCGDLLGFFIYRSENREGPYELQDTLSNPAAVVYEAPNPFGLTYYYYLSSWADCPGDSLLTSDTLSNLPLGMIPIKSLSVVDGNVVVKWEMSEDPNISQYVIYRNTSQGTIPIDTVQNVLEYTDENANPTERVEIYYVLAMDDCGTKSFFDQPHNTLLVNFEIEPCQQQISFEWNEYQNWPGGISYHLLWVERDGVFEVADTMGPGVFSAEYSDLIKDEDFCFYITAENAELGASSESNTICITADIVEPVRDLILYSYCYDEQLGEIDLQWYWNETAEMDYFEILVKGENDNEFSPVYREEIEGPLTGNNTVNLSIPATHGFPSELFIRTVDLCGAEKLSEVVMPLHLSGRTLDEQTNLLEWTYSLPEESFGFDATIERQLLDGRVDPIDVSQVEDNRYEDPTSVNQPEEGRICYTKFISGQLSLPDGEIVSFTCTSNTVCLTKEIKVYVPNAFKPGGVNDIFKPEIVFRESIVSYSMRIYDRWGQLIFESGNPDLGWAGDMIGEPMDQGVYVYMLEIEDENGEHYRSTGSLTLFR